MQSKIHVTAVLLLAVAAAVPAAAQAKREFRYTVAPGASVAVYNEYGPVSVRAIAGRQVVVIATLASGKVEIDPLQTGNRVEFRTHVLQRISESDGSVQYDVSVPPDASVSVRVVNGPITAENILGDLALLDDAGAVELRNCSGGHVRVQTISGPVTLRESSNGYIDITSVSGNVALKNVTGRKVTVNTNRGAIRYDGDVGQNGAYSLINNTGNIDFIAPATASMDVTARSVSGSVENDFPLQPKRRTGFVPQPGRAFTGTSNAGSSTVELRSFSGTIRVKKR